MEPSPYTIVDNRVTVGAERPPYVAVGAGALFVLSVSLYHRRFFRVDQNAMNFLAFTVASAPAAWTYSSFAFSSPTIEAGIKNNAKELREKETTRFGLKFVTSQEMKI